MKFWHRLASNMRKVFGDGNSQFLTRFEGETAAELDTRGAIKALSEIVRKQPDGVETYLALGDLYRTQGEFDRAIQIRHNIIVRQKLPDETKAMAYYELGHDYKRSGLLDLALQAFHQAKNFGAPADAAGLEIARIHAISGNFEDAAVAFGQIGYSVAEAHYRTKMGEEFLAKNSPTVAMNCFKKALNIYPASIEARLAMLCATIREENWKKASKLFKSSFQSILPETRFLFLQGLLEFTDKENLAEEKRKEWNSRLCDMTLEVLDKEAASGLHSYYGALFLLKAGRKEEAISLLEKTLTVEPDFWMARLDLLAIRFSDESLVASDQEQLQSFLDQSSRAKRFICKKCGLRRNVVFFLCPHCLSWHSARFRIRIDD